MGFIQWCKEWSFVIIRRDRIANSKGVRVAETPLVTASVAITEAVSSTGCENKRKQNYLALHGF